jgi:hypothetical protein
MDRIHLPIGPWTGLTLPPVHGPIAFQKKDKIILASPPRRRYISPMTFLHTGKEESAARTATFSH